MNEKIVYRLSADSREAYRGLEEILNDSYIKSLEHMKGRDDDLWKSSVNLRVSEKILRFIVKLLDKFSNKWKEFNKDLEEIFYEKEKVDEILERSRDIIRELHHFEKHEGRIIKLVKELHYEFHSLFPKVFGHIYTNYPTQFQNIERFMTNALSTLSEDIKDEKNFETVYSKEIRPRLKQIGIYSKKLSETVTAETIEHIKNLFGKATDKYLKEAHAH